jgi:hypothetical protein
MLCSINNLAGRKSVALRGRALDFDAEPLVPQTYDLPDLPWERVAGRLEQVAIAVLRLDARLEASGLSAGWQSRCDLTEAVRALILDGQLVDVGDLVLHDAGMDVRHPTHELTRAATALRTALARSAPWPLSIDGLAALRGIGPVRGEGSAAPKKVKPDPEDEAAYPPFADDADPWTAHFAEIDALLERTSTILARELMGRVTSTCRSNSKLPQLVELFLSRPLVTVPLAAKLLKVTPKAVDLMLAQLGGALPRELTGRTRYRAWGIV